MYFHTYHHDMFSKIFIALLNLNLKGRLQQVTNFGASNLTKSTHLRRSSFDIEMWDDG